MDIDIVYEDIKKSMTKNIYNLENFGKLDQKKQIANLIRLKDPIIFAEELLGIKLYDYQKDLLNNHSKRLHIRKGRQVGASYILALKCVIHAMLVPDCVIAIISPSQRQSSLVFKYIYNFFNGHELLRPEIQTKDSRSSQTVIQLANNSVIYSLPCGNDGRTIRGMSIGPGSIMIVDEAAFIPEKVWEAIDYFTATGGQEIISSTPLGKRGRFYDSYLDQSYDHVHIPTTLNPTISKDWLKQREGLPSFQAEIMGEFTGSEGNFFQPDLVRSIIDADLTWDESPLKSVGLFKMAGLDVGIERDPAVLTIMKKENGVFKPVYINAFKKKNDKDSYQLDFVPVNSYHEIVEQVKAQRIKYDFNYIAVDATNDAFIAETIGKEMTTHPVKFSSTAKNGNPMKSELMHTLLAGMVSGKVKIPNHPTLVRQLLNYEFEITDNKNYKFSETDEDFIDSMALCLYNELAIEAPDNFAVC